MGYISGTEQEKYEKFDTEGGSFKNQVRFSKA